MNGSTFSMHFFPFFQDVSLQSRFSVSSLWSRPKKRGTIIRRGLGADASSLHTYVISSSQVPQNFLHKKDISLYLAAFWAFRVAFLPSFLPEYVSESGGNIVPSASLPSSFFLLTPDMKMLQKNLFSGVGAKYTRGSLLCQGYLFSSNACVCGSGWHSEYYNYGWAWAASSWRLLKELQGINASMIA